MKCLACIERCPTSAIKVEALSCPLLSRAAPLRVDEARCDSCGLCNDICPMGDITFARGCSFCIICRGRPNCVLPAGHNSFIHALLRFLILL